MHSRGGSREQLVRYESSPEFAKPALLKIPAYL